MAINLLVSKGFGNTIFNGDIPSLTRRGFDAVISIDEPVFGSFVISHSVIILKASSSINILQSPVTALRIASVSELPHWNVEIVVNVYKHVSPVEYMESLLLLVSTVGFLTIPSNNKRFVDKDGNLALFQCDSLTPFFLLNNIDNDACLINFSSLDPSNPKT